MAKKTHEVELKVKVKFPKGTTPKRAAELITRLINAGAEDAANAPSDWADKDLPAIEAMGEITVSPIPADRIAFEWSVEDVQSQCDTVTDDEAMEVLQFLYRNHDVTIGVNWDVMDSAIRHLYPERLKEANEDDEDEEDDES